MACGRIKELQYSISLWWHVDATRNCNVLLSLRNCNEVPRWNVKFCIYTNHTRTQDQTDWHLDVTYHCRRWGSTDSQRRRHRPSTSREIKYINNSHARSNRLASHYVLVAYAVAERTVLGCTNSQRRRHSRIDESTAAWDQVYEQRTNKIEPIGIMSRTWRGRSRWNCRTPRRGCTDSQQRRLSRTEESMAACRRCLRRWEVV